MNSSSWHNIKPLCPISDLTHNGLVISNIFYILKQNIYFFEIFKFYHHFTNLKLQKIAPPPTDKQNRYVFQHFFVKNFSWQYVFN